MVIRGAVLAYSPPMFRLILAFAITCSLAACSKKKQEEAPPAETPTAPTTGSAGATAAATTAPAGGAAEEAKTMFAQLCSTCHGTDGTGNGPAAANLEPKPRNYTDQAWQASVTDDDLRKIIVEGGGAVGKSPMMPPNPQLKDKPQVVDELVKIVRSFGKS